MVVSNKAESSKADFYGNDIETYFGAQRDVQRLKNILLSVVVLVGNVMGLTHEEIQICDLAKHNVHQSMWILKYIGFGSDANVSSSLGDLKLPPFN